MGDSDRIIKFSTGKKETFERFVREYERRIFHTVYRIVGNREDAMDITQTVFLKAYEKFDLYEPSRKFFTWLYRIAINESINFIKGKKQTMEIGQNLEALEKNPEEYVTGAMMADRLQDALKTLKLDYRVVIVMKYFLDLSYEQIGELLNIPVKTVKSRLFMARELLKDILIK